MLFTIPPLAPGACLASTRYLLVKDLLNKCSLQELGKGDIRFPILQMKKLRYR